MRVLVAVDAHGTITEARFVANACAICVAAASLLTERVTGVAADAAREIDTDDMLLLIGDGVPATRRKCATLPLEALRLALAPA